MLWGGGGSPFSVVKDGEELRSVSGERVHLLGDVRSIIHELGTDRRWKDTVVAVASRCDEPAWARECLSKFSVGGGLSLKDVMSGPDEIYKGSKADHLRTISRKTGVPLGEMVFFDNEPGNCQIVSGVGVTAVYTPEGLTRKLFQQAMDEYPAPGKIVGRR